MIPKRGEEAPSVTMLNNFQTPAVSSSDQRRDLVQEGAYSAKSYGDDDVSVEETHSKPEQTFRNKPLHVFLHGIFCRTVIPVIVFLIGLVERSKSRAVKPHREFAG
jgi:hypothetical protein